MGAADIDLLAKEWPVITGAPHLVIGGILVIIAAAVPITWYFVNWGYRQRLKLADEKVAWANQVKDEGVRAIEAERQFKELKAEIMANAGHGALAERVVKIEAAIEKLSAANNAVNSAIGIAIGASTATGISDSFSNPSLALRAAQAEIYKQWWE